MEIPRTQIGKNKKQEKQSGKQKVGKLPVFGTSQKVKAKVKKKTQMCKNTTLSTPPIRTARVLLGCQ